VYQQRFDFNEDLLASLCGLSGLLVQNQQKHILYLIHDHTGAYDNNAPRARPNV
jgi:hypothetical protein